MSRAYTIIAVIIFVIALVFVAVVGYLILNPAEEEPETVILPTSLVLPTVTNTPRQPPTLPPTFTATDTFTPTFTPTPTLTSSITLSPTITDTPLPTATASFTPSVTNTRTPTITPTSDLPTALPTATESPFPFELWTPVQVRQNANNTAGCAWQGFGGQVLNIDGGEFSGALDIHIFNEVFDRRIKIGTNSLYGTISGWEMKVSDQTFAGSYFVQLEANQVPISDRIQVDFPGTCEQNLALVTFKQFR